MQLLQRLLINENDAEQLLTVALQTAQHRVIVKRPRLVDYLNGKKPDWQISGKSTRFDIYAINH